MKSPRKLFVYGFPGLYGGAATELFHQFIIWKRMGVEIHLIPSLSNYRELPLYKETLEMGVIVHGHNAVSYTHLTLPTICSV